MRSITLNFAFGFITCVAMPSTPSPPNQMLGSDARIEHLVRDSYTFKAFLNEDDIRANCTGGVVTLTGTVAHEYHKQLILETTVGIPGVRGVTSRLILAGDQPLACSDHWITMRVEAILFLHKYIRASGVHVFTESGLVTLTGTANTEIQKQLVTDWAKDIEGVEEVLNHLVVARPETVHRMVQGLPVDDASLRAQVKVALLYHKSTHLLTSHVVSQGGVVTLSGEVESGAQYDQVSRLVDNIHGVAWVNNRMTVREQKRP